MKRLKAYVGFLSLQLLTIHLVQAQQLTLQVVTKTIEKQWEWQPNKLLKINGANAQITVEGWDKNTIAATIELIAKHTERTTAERDVLAQKVIIETTNKLFLLGNQIVLEEGQQKPVSNLKAVYTIYVPRECSVEINNKFGKVELRGIKSKVRINGQFTNVDLKKINGKIVVGSNFGDIVGQQLTGKVTIDANRSDVQLEQPSGDFIIKTQRGSVTILEDQNRQFDLSVKGQRANVVFIEPVLLAHNFHLTTEFGEINLPPSSAFELTETSTNRKEAVLARGRNATQISVVLSHGDITLK
ncbi:MAG: hypothetical protein AAF960_21690 [Bacteroidota bacterium]